MSFNPKDEPCSVCGNEPEECICELTMDLPDDLFADLEFDDKEYYYEDGERENNGGADQDEGGY